jgi:hypothetical protein
MPTFCTPAMMCAHAYARRYASPCVRTHARMHADHATRATRARTHTHLRTYTLTHTRCGWRLYSERIKDTRHVSQRHVHEEVPVDGTFALSGQLQFDPLLQLPWL